MKLTITRIYDCEKVRARDLPDSAEYHDWIETLADVPMSIYGSVDWLRSQHPRKMVYGLAFDEETAVLK